VAETPHKETDMNFNLSNGVKVSRVSAGAGAATTDVNSSILDMSGYEGVVFIASLGDVTTTCALALKCEQDDLNAAGGMSELTGSASYTADADEAADDKIIKLDVFRPLKRYVRAVLERGTANAVVDGIIAIQYGAAVKPPQVPPGDFTLTSVDGTDATLAAFLLGELATAKGSAVVVGDIFQVLGTGDTTDDALEAAKGAAVVANDVFEVTDISTATVLFRGNNDANLIAANLLFSPAEV